MQITRISQQLFTLLTRRLPRRLFQRDQLPTKGPASGSAPLPTGLSEFYLQQAARSENALYQHFNSHPEGLNEKEVDHARA
ncbi:MAG: hypothetical protein ACRCR6_00035, partial [Plesiomonas sp.]